MERLVYVNGEMVPESEAKVSVFDVGFLYGATFFESVRTFKHKFFKLDEHLSRLERSLRYAGIPDIITKEKMADIMSQVLDANIHLTDKEDDMWMCAEVTPGKTFPMPLMKQIDKTPTVIVYSSAMPHSEYVKYYTQGKHVVTSLIRNTSPQNLDSRAKNRNRVPHFLAKLEIVKRDPDAIALFLDLAGNITEGTGANIFFVLDGILFTPTTKNILNGISRLTVIELAEKMNIKVIEKDLTLYDAYNAEEAFWTTTSYCILPISMIDGRKIGDAYPGPYAKKLLDAWSKEVEVDIIGQAQKFANK
ncbi:MAG: aminotransferase class IV [bacterium]|nr:aminotransferase class IV [bacterium]